MLLMCVCVIWPLWSRLLTLACRAGPSGVHRHWRVGHAVLLLPVRRHGSHQRQATSDLWHQDWVQGEFESFEPTTGEMTLLVVWVVLFFLGGGGGGSLWGMLLCICFCSLWAHLCPTGTVDMHYFVWNLFFLWFIYFHLHTHTHTHTHSHTEHETNTSEHCKQQLYFIKEGSTETGEVALCPRGVIATLDKTREINCTQTAITFIISDRD